MSYLKKLVSSNSFEFKAPIAYSNPDQEAKLKSLREDYPDFNIELKNSTVTSSNEVSQNEEAEVLFLVDISGSIDTNTKEHFAAIQEGIIESLKEKYDHVSHGVILHHTQAKCAVTGFGWINGAETGGTIVSSAYRKAQEYINCPDVDYYIVQLTDGDNWADDNSNTNECINKLALSGVRGFKYFEVTDRPTQSLFDTMTRNDCVEVFRMKVGNLTVV